MAEVKKTKAMIAQEKLCELCTTLEECPHIKKVWFDARGNHFFVARELNGKFYSQLKIGTKDLAAANGDVRVAVKHEGEAIYELVKSETRDEILKRKPKLSDED